MGDPNLIGFIIGALVGVILDRLALYNASRFREVPESERNPHGK